jgi:ubiquinone/menaquinone biosynthesis C-methylase UbiE
MRWAYHLLYNQLAWAYDAIAWLVSLGQWQAWGRVALRYVRGSQVLDLAHGPGHLLAALDAAGYQCTGLDLSPAMGRQATRTLRALGQTPHLGRGRAQTLPFAANSFDTVITTFPAEFIMQASTLREIRRVLRPDGVLIIVPGAQFTEAHPAGRAIELLFARAGQMPERSPLLPIPFQETGFDVRAEWVPLPGSQVQVLVAEPQKRPLTDPGTG